MTAPQSGLPAISPIAEFLNAALAPPQGNGSDLGFVTAQIQSWDEISGTNTVVLAGGVTISNLKSIQPGIGVQYQPGDVVGLKRVGNSYLVEGRIATPGAGAGNQIRSNRVAFQINAPDNMAFGDLPGTFGPDLQGVYIGSSRRCLVIHSFEVYVYGLVDVGNGATAYQGVTVSGASNFAVETAVTDAFLGGQAGTTASATATTLVTAADGLNQGFHRFTCKYKTACDTASQHVQINNRVLSVIPF